MCDAAHVADGAMRQSHQVAAAAKGRRKAAHIPAAGARAAMGWAATGPLCKKTYMPMKKENVA